MTALSRVIDALRGNAEQWQAFTNQGHTVVLAPPGSGKTQLLSARAAVDLLGTSRGPRGAACITMTNEAALELSRRLWSMGVTRRPNLFIGTVHSFALRRIILPFARAAGDESLASSRVADDAEAKAILQELYLRSPLKDESFSSVMLTVNRARQRMDLSGDPLLGGPKIAALGREFAETLRANQTLDFIELVACATELVEENAWVRQSLEACFPQLYVDEYQDLATGLDRIVRAMTVDSPAQDSTLFAVGDPDQSVYGFSGAHPQLLRALSADTRVSTVRLRVNYRSDQQVIDSALTALGSHREIAGEAPGGVLHVHTAPGGVEAQSKKCVELVRAAIDSGVSRGQIAVLASWNSDREAAGAALRAAGIPCHSRSRMEWRSSSATLVVERFAAWAANGAQSGLELGALLDALEELSSSPITHGGRVEALRVLTKAGPADPAAGFLKQLMAAAALGHEFTHAAPESSLEGMRVGLEAAGMKVGELGDIAHSSDRVLVSTIHASKGLEFDHVVIVGLDEQAFPGWNVEKSQVEESRRLLYVAITRARHIVDIVHTDRRWSQRKNKFYSVNPSPFLRGLQ